MNMKKIYFLPLVALAMTACESDFKGPWGTPQENEQLPLFDLSDISFKNASATASTINLSQYNDNDLMVPFLNIESIKDFPEGYELKLMMDFAADENFNRMTTLETEIETVDGPATVGIAPDVLQNAFSQIISKGPKAKDVFVRFAPYAVNGSEEVRLGIPSEYIGGMTINVLPIPSTFVIEDNYYLLGTINGWDVATAVKFEHSDENVYDDPVFTLAIEADAADGWWWKIIPESTYLTGNWVEADNAAFGVAENGDSELEGMLVGRTAAEDCGSGCLKVTGPYLMTINMEELTYTFEPRVQYLYTPGQTNGWNQVNSQQLATADFENYEGFAFIGDGFKFTSAPDWDHTNYGAGAEDGILSTAVDAGNLSVSPQGLYWCKVNTADLEWSATEITAAGLIGDFNGWAQSAPLTAAADNPTIWQGTVDFGDGNGSYKIRFNDAWEISLGGDPQNLDWHNADNIPAPGAGKYSVTLYLNAFPYEIEVSPM